MGLSARNDHWAGKPEDEPEGYPLYAKCIGVSVEDKRICGGTRTERFFPCEVVPEIVRFVKEHKNVYRISLGPSFMSRDAFLGKYGHMLGEAPKEERKEFSLSPEQRKENTRKFAEKCRQEADAAYQDTMARHETARKDGEHKKTTKRNIDVIRELPAEELAKLLVKTVCEEEVDYDWDEEPYCSGISETYVTSDGRVFCDMEDAVVHEAEWLGAEAETEGAET